MRSTKTRNNGFTLIEIMVVLSILGLLMSIALPRMTGRTQEARIQTTKLQIENLASAVDAFEFDCGRFPTPEEGLNALREAPFDGRGWNGPYLKKAIPLDPWQEEFVYDVPGQRSVDYDIFSKGPDRQAGTGDDIGSW